MVLSGEGFVKLADRTIPLGPGGIAVILKGVCHAYHNQSPDDTVLIATFSPADSSREDCPPV